MVYIIDDDRTIRLALSLILKQNRIDCKVFANPSEAYDAIRGGGRPDVVLLDMNFGRTTDGNDGLEALRRIKVLSPEASVILLTGWGSIPLAVEGMRLGAYDFLSKPIDTSNLLGKIATCLSIRNGDSDCRDAYDCLNSSIVGESDAIQKVLATAAKVAPTDAAVLITGDNGTGKEMLARAIHASSARASKPFVAVNLGGIPASLFESEMFGHVKGAFTGAIADREGRFAMADGGTLFLDEIGELDLNCQVKLLRALQEHTFEPLGSSRTRHADFRLICATNADITKMIAERKFREDLYYRINLITLHMPPLRERGDDIIRLAHRFAESSASAYSKPTPDLAPSAVAALRAWKYPGNVRELKNIVDRAVLLGGGVLKADDFVFLPSGNLNSYGTSVAGTLNLDDIERHAIEEALRRERGNISSVAASLGISRQALYRRMEKYGLDK